MKLEVLTMPNDETVDPDQMQSIVDKLKAEGRMPTPETLSAAIAEARADYQKSVVKARKQDRFQARARKRNPSKKTS